MNEKVIVSKKHHCYKIHTLLMKISAYPTIFTENLDSLFHNFSIISTPPPPPINKGEGFTLWNYLGIMLRLTSNMQMNLVIRPTNNFFKLAPFFPTFFINHIFI